MVIINFIPSLERIALVTVATSMWTKPDIKDLVEHDDITSVAMVSNSLDERVAKVKERVDKIPIPERLKKELSRFIRPVGHEIWAWLRCEHGYSSLDMKNTEDFYWTNRGTIDTKKTAQKLIQDEKVDLDTRYKIAAIHCLEDDFHSLRKRYGNIHGVCDVSFTVLVESCLRNEHARVQPNFLIIIDWYLRVFKSHNQRMFQYAAFTGNEAATLYFLQKLTPEEKQNTLQMTMRILALEGIQCILSPCLLLYRSCIPNILFLLLSNISKEQRAMAFENDGIARILRCFLDYPWQYLLFEVMEHSATYLLENSFYSLLTYIDFKSKRSDEYDYENFLAVFFLKCPIAIKRRYFRLDDIYFEKLLSHGNKNRELYLNDLLSVRGKEVIFQKKGKSICEYLIEKNLWDVFKFFIQKCITSGDLMVKFKEEFSEYIVISESSLPKATREMSLNIIDDCIRSFNKRGAVEDHRPAKQLCFMKAEGLN